MYNGISEHIDRTILGLCFIHNQGRYIYPILDSINVYIKDIT